MPSAKLRSANLPVFTKEKLTVLHSGTESVVYFYYGKQGKEKLLHYLAKSLQLYKGLNIFLSILKRVKSDVIIGRCSWYSTPLLIRTVVNFSAKQFCPY